jgi:hypothetical protein
MLPARRLPLISLAVGLGALDAQALAQTLILTNQTLTTPVGTNFGSTLQFGSGGVGFATLELTGIGAQVFSGNWIVDGSGPIFRLAPGVTLGIQPAVRGEAFSSPLALTVVGGGTLILGPNSYLRNWRGGLRVGDDSTLSIGESDWITSASSMVIDAGGKLRYRDSAAARFTGLLNVADAGSRATIDVGSENPARQAGNLTFLGSVTGPADLRILNGLGVGTGTTEVILSFDAGSYDGRLLLDGSRVTLGNARGIGAGGIQVLNDARLTIGSSMSTGASQLLDLQADLTLLGSSGLEVLNWGGDIDVGANMLTVQDLQVTMGSSSTIAGLGGSIDLASGGILDLNGATANTTILGSGGFLAGPGTVASIGDGSGFDGTIQFGNGSSAGTLSVTGDASVANAFLESLLFTGTGAADQLNVTGTLTGFDQASLDVIYDASVAGGALIPATGTSQDYTIVTAGTLANGTPGALALTTIDPLNNNFSILLLDPSAVNTTASGAQFEWIATPGAGGTGILRITGAPNPSITVPGSTQTNIGTVNNSSLVNAVQQLNSIGQQPGQTADGHYVVSSLLLLSPDVLPGAVVTAAVAANPDALPNTTFDSMSQAGRVAKLRLMDLRRADAGAAAWDGPSSTQQYPQYASAGPMQDAAAGDVVSQPLAIGAGLNGASPAEGSRFWARGYGFESTVDGSSLAQGDYSAAVGGAMIGADTVLDGGLLAGGFIGFTPGSLSIDTTLGNTDVSLLGVNFGGYASWSPSTGDGYLQGYAMGGYNYADQSRNISIPGLVRTAESGADVWGAMLGAEGGFNLDVSDGTVVQPYASLEYGYYTRAGYSESGAGSLDLNVSGQEASLLQPSCGARLMKTFGFGQDRVTPFLGAAFIAQLPIGSWSETATNGFTGAQVFTFSEGAAEQYGASFEGGLELASIGGWTAYVSFNGMAMTDTTILGGQIGINLSF